MSRAWRRRNRRILVALGAAVALIVAGSTALVAPVVASQSQEVPAGWTDVSATLPTLESLPATSRRAVGDDEFWVGYTFALRDEVHIGCGDRRGRNISFGDDDIQLRVAPRRGEVDDEPCDDRFGLFLRFDGSESVVSEARLLTLRRASRRLDEPVVWAGEFPAGASVAFLRPAVLGGRGSVTASSEEVRKRMLSAVAVHDDSVAVEVVLAALDSAHAAELRESAVFWASQVAADEGLQRLLGLARNDDDTEVRKQSIFWLGQVAGEHATADLADIAADDPNTEVRQSAVFALSQSEDDAAIEALIRIVRSHDNPEVVKSALFWLGQSGDPRAVELFEQLIFGGR